MAAGPATGAQPPSGPPGGSRRGSTGGRRKGGGARPGGPRAPPPAPSRRPVLLGGAGVARLAVGEGEEALDLEIRGLDSFSGPHFQRLAIRLSIGGRPILDDLDERASTATGWEMATPS